MVIEADRPVSEVLDCFFQYPIHHLPVVRDGRLAGMLSSADVMKLECFLPKSATGSRELPRRAADDRAADANSRRQPAGQREPR